MCNTHHETIADRAFSRKGFTKIMAVAWAIAAILMVYWGNYKFAIGWLAVGGPAIMLMKFSAEMAEVYDSDG